MDARRAVSAVAVAVVLLGATGAASPPARDLPHPPILWADLARPAPDRLVIPKLGLDAPVVALRLHSGELATSPGLPTIGWYERGTSPGELGCAVLLGPAVIFARLRLLAPGDLVRVVRRDGQVASFVVERVEPYSERELPAEPGQARLRLVPYAAGSAPVVFASLAGGAG
jgi:hypothetical protein